MNGNLQAWFRGALAAVLGGAASAVTARFTTDEVHWEHLGPVAAAGALLGLAMYLTRSPVWNEKK